MIDAMAAAAGSAIFGSLGVAAVHVSQAYKQTSTTVIFVANEGFIGEYADTVRLADTVTLPESVGATVGDSIVCDAGAFAGTWSLTRRVATSARLTGSTFEIARQ